MGHLSGYCIKPSLSRCWPDVADCACIHGSEGDDPGGDEQGAKGASVLADEPQQGWTGQEGGVADGGDDADAGRGV